MAADDFNPADVDELLALLVEQTSLRSASTDPSKLGALPGCWARIDALRYENLAGLTVALTLHLIVGEQEVGRALAALAPLLNELVPVLNRSDLELGGGPTGDVRVVRVPLPGSTTGLPALAVPFDLNTTQE